MAMCQRIPDGTRDSFMTGVSHERDEETVKVNEEKTDLESQHHSVSSKIDKTTAEQFTLDGGVSEYLAELTERSKQQLKMNTVRNTEREILVR